jgi:hypothetical protein
LEAFVLKKASKPFVRRVIRYCCRLLGIDGIEARLGEIRRSNDQITANLHLLSEKLDVLLHHRHSTERTDLHVSREVDRLDGYLQYHIETIRQDLKLLLDAEEPAVDNKEPR